MDPIKAQGLLISGRADVVVAHESFVEMRAVDLIDRLRTDGCTVPVIVLDGDLTIDKAVNAMKHGAAAAMATPFNVNELLVAVNRAMRDVAASSRTDVFVSYRRDTGGVAARAISLALRQRGLAVFLDIDDSVSGRFDDRLVSRIGCSATVLVILTPGSLANCAAKEDWFRREIALAIRLRRKVLPLLMPGFRFPGPGVMPREIAALATQQGLNYSADYFDAMIDRLVQYVREP